MTDPTEQPRKPVQGLLPFPPERGEAASLVWEGALHGPAAWEKSRKQTQQLMEAVASEENLQQALKKVCANRGAPGIDGMTVDDLRGHYRLHKQTIRESLLRGDYRPTPVLRREIPKPGGGMRALGIPTVLDRLIQQALLQILDPIFDPLFSASSHGFRPGRSAHQAVLQAQAYIQEGRRWIVDMDIEKFFDHVHHDILMSRVSRRIGDKRVLQLIGRFLRAGIMVQGVVITSDEGTPQGGPLSPLLANILLDDLDRELERRGHRFCRYADDCNIYVHTERAAQRVLESVKEFLAKKLKLKLNEQKSKVTKPQESKFLGMGFTTELNTRIRLHEKSQERFKETIRTKTRRTLGRSLAEILRDLNGYQRGWMNYFQLIDADSVLTKLDGWIRRRLRCYVWKQWRCRSARYANLRALGLQHRNACKHARSSTGPWNMAQVIRRTLDEIYLRDKGYKSLTQIYQQLRPVT